MDNHEFNAINPTDQMNSKDFGVYGACAPELTKIEDRGDNVKRYSYLASDGRAYPIPILSLSGNDDYVSTVLKGRIEAIDKFIAKSPHSVA